MSVLRGRWVALAACAVTLAGACATPALDEEPTPEVPRPQPEGGTLPARDAGRPPAPVADEAGTADAASDVDAASSLRVFVSSTAVTGDLLGLAGGDAACNELAKAAALGGSWIAWLSNSGGPHAVDRLTSVGPWRLVTGEVVATTKAGLTAGSLMHAIDRDEKGVALAAASRVWTGTGPDGRYATNDCSKWTGAGNNDGRHGETSSTTSTWTSAGVDSCNNLRHLYCFEK
jgi:hypothetical protein